MPGGVAGIKVMVDQLKAAGVNVLWPYNPWDQGTDGGSDNRTKAGSDDAVCLPSFFFVSSSSFSWLFIGASSPPFFSFFSFFFFSLFPLLFFFPCC